MRGHLVRRNGVYWFRRRVPEALRERFGRSEIHRSLKTTSAREAAERGKRAWLATEAVFSEMAKNPTLQERQARLLIEQLLTEPLHNSPTGDELANALLRGEGAIARQLFNRTAVDMIMELPAEQRAALHAHMDKIADLVELGSALSARDTARVRAEIARHDASQASAALEEARRELAQTAVAREVADKLASLAAGMAARAPEPPTPALPAPEAAPVKPGRAKAKPLWSEVARSFIAEKSRVVEGHREYDQQTVRQTESTVQLWADLLGDRPVDKYDGADAGAFRDLMLRMPASHGKSGTRAEVRRKVPPLEAILRADERQKEVDAKNAVLTEGAERLVGVDRLKMKTLKRHFSTLSQLWIHAGRLGHVPREPNIFRGWEYQGVRRGAKKKRGPWSAEDINKLYSSDWFTTDATGTDNWWVTLIAQWSGLRVEEIFRLRPALDIREVSGIMVFEIQDHAPPDRWSPKTEAGARTVPVHSVLLGLGFMDFVERRRREGAQRLFAAQRRPSSNKLSARFVSDFSRAKTRLGIGPLTTFHSWRHSISTILRNTKLREARETWIDAILGHSGGEDEDADGRCRPQSEGVTTYFDAVSIENLRDTVEAIRYPAEVDLSRLRKPD